MGKTDGTSTEGAITLASFRDIVRMVAVDLRSAGLVESADRLDAAASTDTSPQDELLGMREAMVETRPDWGARGTAAVKQGAVALSRAKRLAIDL